MNSSRRHLLLKYCAGFEIFALQNVCRTVPQRCKLRKPRKTESLRSHAASHILPWRALLQKTLPVNPRSDRSVRKNIKAFCKQPSNASEVWVLWSTHVNKIRLSRCLSASGFLPSPPPPPPPLSSFWLSHHFSRGQNTENPVSLICTLGAQANQHLSHTLSLPVFYSEFSLPRFKTPDWNRVTKMPRSRLFLSRETQFWIKRLTQQYIAHVYIFTSITAHINWR